MKKVFKVTFLPVLVALALISCVGHADKDGHKSLEGASDPVNNGGKLSGDHFRSADKTDSLKTKDITK